MALAQSADRRIAGHGTNRVEAMGYERRPAAHPRGRGRCLTAGVTASDHDNVE
jgi:hypothetical protein